MTGTNRRIVMGGEGGQGVQTAADILAQAAFEKGKEALYMPNFGIEQRGGVSLAFVQMGENPIGSPKFDTAHLVVALSARSLERLQAYLNEESTLLYDSSLQAPPEISDAVVGRQAYATIAPEAFAERRMTGRRQEFPGITKKVKRVLGLPAGEMASSRLHPRVSNIIVLGASARLTGILRLEDLNEALMKRLANKVRRDPKLKELNLQALELGWEAAAGMLKGHATGATV